MAGKITEVPSVTTWTCTPRRAAATSSWASRSRVMWYIESLITDPPRVPSTSRSNSLLTAYFLDQTLLVGSLNTTLMDAGADCRAVDTMEACPLAGRLRIAPADRAARDALRSERRNVVASFLPGARGLAIVGER